MENLPEPTSAQDGDAHANRGNERDSTFLNANVRFGEGTPPVVSRVRNISPGGTMVDTTRVYPRGLAVIVEVKGVGEVPGRIAWSSASRAGIAFDEQIDPMAARVKFRGDGPPRNFVPPTPGGRRPGLTIR